MGKYDLFVTMLSFAFLSKMMMIGLVCFKVWHFRTCFVDICYQVWSPSTGVNFFKP